jgi:hypothetical protein
MRREGTIILALLAFAPAARADDASSKATAEALFRDARQLMKDGRFDAACPKLAESQRLDPAAGTLLNLAECYEKNGQTASAWATFGEAARAAELRKRADWKATADARVKELEPTLSYLTIEVDPDTAAAPGVTVHRDRDEVHRASWATALPIDPGPHTVSASASGRIDWKTDIEVKKTSDRVTVKVPKLALAPVATPVTAPPPPPRAAKNEETSHFRRTTVGLGLVGVGAAVLATGLVFGFFASNQWSTADRLCPGDTCSDQNGIDASKKAHTFATVSTIGVIAGGVLAAAGIGIWTF